MNSTTDLREDTGAAQQAPANDAADRALDHEAVSYTHLTLPTTPYV